MAITCLTSLCFPQFGFAGLMVAVKDDTWPTHFVIFNEVVEIAIGLVEQAKERLFVQEREEVYLRVRPGTEIPSLNISMFHSCQKALIFSTASKKGATSKLLYQARNSLTVIIWFSSHTCWQCQYTLLLRCLYKENSVQRHSLNPLLVCSCPLFIF